MANEKVLNGKTLYVAAYGFKYKVAFSILVLATAGLMVAAGVVDQTGSDRPELLFAITAVGYLVLAAGFLMTIWRSRVYFGHDALLIRKALTTFSRTYSDIGELVASPGKITLRFKDGLQVVINAHMADLPALIDIVHDRTDLR